MTDYTKLRDRKKIIDAINSPQNNDRKARSLMECEIYNDDISPYVTRYLQQRRTQDTVNEMPIISTINLSKKISDQEASIYKNPPTRTFTNLTDEQTEVALKIYEDMMADFKLLNANRFYRLQKQHHVMVAPMNGKLSMRNYKNHHIDAVENPENPESALGYVLSGFDKNMHNRHREYRDHDAVNQPIGDEEDYKSKNQTHVVWTPELHFKMNGKGKVLSEEADNPLREFGLMPFVDIALHKDFEYFLTYGNALTDFCIEFNGELSSLAHVVDLHSFAQAVVKGPPELLPKQINIGPNHLILLPSDPDTEGETDFQFVSPNSDIQGAQQFIESLLSMFLSSRGVDPRTVSGSGEAGETFTSGIQRLLAMVEKFEASREDVALFERVERDVWALIKAWHNVLRDTDLLDDKYKTQPFPEDSEVMVEFAKPELVTTDKERLENIKMELDLGLVSQRMAVQRYHDVDDDKTDEIMEEIDGEMNADNEDQEQLLSRPEQETRGDEQEISNQG